MEISEQIRSWRVFKGLSQSSLAQRAGIPRPNLVDLERGRRDCTVKTLTKLAKALKITPGTLLDQSPLPPVSLNRFEIDQIARALCRQETNTLPRLQKFTDLARPVVAPLLRAGGVKPIGPAGKTIHRTPSYLLRARDEIGAENLDRLIRRVTKLLASRK